MYEVCLKLQKSRCMPVGNTEIHPHRVQQLRRYPNQCQVLNECLKVGSGKSYWDLPGCRSVDEYHYIIVLATRYPLTLAYHAGRFDLPYKGYIILL
ncbi:hypothetical protein Desal_1006 [Maridesulfovibrio salexigens DSM 2638]|uniref:Uncharacterized protein n=1 Tax=Maridesulfovibrio salexigens (strain ATCC 14822 / DSM 2638 / NCIMB 8403 / VKM B-1763) TaxID=526222 RepID=C6C0D7_MARSD|nr:hypothetical protein Desal_1006 [Maridesulfovibrio salexigens DSM 2638]